MEREKKSEKEGEREIEKEGERESEKEGERARELLFLFLKGMTGALAPFSYLVFNKNQQPSVGLERERPANAEQRPQP
jgi:hypothetical protein